MPGAGYEAAIRVFVVQDEFRNGLAARWSLPARTGRNDAIEGLRPARGAYAAFWRGRLVTLAPIALFVYNRPAHTRHTVAALRANPLAALSGLHVFSDGPKTAETAASVREVRAYLRTIDGFASVKIYERERNFGLAASVIDGVTRLCEAYGQVIVVEDDLEVAQGFLTYLNTALDRYRAEPGVMQISAHMFPVDVPVLADAFFLPFVSSWGWATWDRAWRTFDPLATGYAQLKSDTRRRHAFNMNGAYDYFSMLEAQLKGKIDSWAIRWNLSVFMNDGLVLYPRKSLVENTGFDGSGVHCHGEALNQVIDAGFIPEILPEPAIDPEVKAEVFDYFRARRSPRARLRALAARLFG
jgi:hypothetical protein